MNAELSGLAFCLGRESGRPGPMAGLDTELEDAAEFSEVYLTRLWTEED